MNFSQDELKNLTVKHNTFVGIDSDGCVFDTMEKKQRQCFFPNIISHWHLDDIADLVCETAAFVNLYSTSRGSNRFIALTKTFDLLRQRPEVIAAGIEIPELAELKRFINSGTILGNNSLFSEIQKTDNQELQSVFDWSITVNKCIEDTVKNIQPFNWSQKSLERIKEHSDSIVVSQTPIEALNREWQDNNLTSLVAFIAGQEHGTKTEHIRLATSGKYSPENILMIGDAPGDKKAAKENNALFYPINPAHETESWERFYKEAYDKFLNGTYSGKYEENVINEFEDLLPNTPPWKTKNN